MAHFGLLNIDKPPSWTSREAVDHVARLVRPTKVGHAGTLDPLATGVLLVLVGPATRLMDYSHRLPKRYRATFLLGRQSATDDIEGEVTELESVAEPSAEQLASVLPSFLGQIEQRPPAHSAVKVQGRRAYKLARRGEAVELRPRPVMIHSLAVVRYEYPELVLDIECGTGTYVRALGRDMAEALGTAAVMSALVRTAIGPFRVEESLAVDAIDGESLAGQILPPVEVLVDIPRITLTADEMIEVRNGRYIGHRVETMSTEFAALDESGVLLAILESAGGRLLRPVRNFG
jgi:tRNA pseudouridine55 synthase